jgi:methyl-accepting chemotaxis protein
MAAFTITLPPTTQAEIDGLIADLRTAAQKYSALADKLNASVPTISNNLDLALESVTASVTAAQASIQEIADAAKTFKFSGPLGMHGQST